MGSDYWLVWMKYSQAASTLDQGILYLHLGYFFPLSFFLLFFFFFFFFFFLVSSPNHKPKHNILTIHVSIYLFIGP
jgi:hypothetical protein